MKATKFLSTITAVVGWIAALCTTYLAVCMVSLVELEEDINFISDSDIIDFIVCVPIPILLLMATLTMLSLSITSPIKGTKSSAAVIGLSTLAMTAIASIMKLGNYLWDENVWNEMEIATMMIFIASGLALINLIGYVLFASKITKGTTRFSAVALSISSLLYATYCSVYYAIMMIDEEVWWNFVFDDSHMVFQEIMAAMLAIYALCTAVFFSSLPANFKQTAGLGNPPIVNPQTYAQPTPPFSEN